METVYRGLVYRIYPNQEQSKRIDQIISNANFVYNHFIHKNQESFKSTGKKLKLNETIRELPKLKKEFPLLKEGESTSLQQSLRHLDSAYQNFLNKRSSYPRFKSKNYDRSYTCTKNGCNPPNIRVEDGMLILPRLGKVKIKLHTPIPENTEIMSATVRKNYSDKYEVTLQVKSEIEIEPTEEPSFLGLVYSSTYFFIASDGMHGNIPENYKKVQERIAKLKRNIKEKKTNSKNYVKEVQKLRKAYEKATNIKKDYIHKWTKEISDKFNVIGIKKLNPKYFDVEKSSREGWNLFIKTLTYKVEAKGGKVMVFDSDDFPKEEIKDFSLESGIEKANLVKELTELTY